jgi:hypothetical protein
MCWETDRHMTIAKRVDALLRNARKADVEVWHADLLTTSGPSNFEITRHENEWTLYCGDVLFGLDTVFRRSGLPSSSGPNMETAYFSKTLASTDQSTRRSNPKEHHQNLKDRENFKSQKWTPLLECRSARSQTYCRCLQQLTEFHWSFMKVLMNLSSEVFYRHVYQSGFLCYLRYFYRLNRVKFHRKKRFLSTVLEHNEMSDRGSLTRAAFLFVSYPRAEVSFFACRISDWYALRYGIEFLESCFIKVKRGSDRPTFVSVLNFS